MQQQDRYHEQQLAARLAVVAPHAWGIRDPRFDLAALQAGQLALTHLRAVLPDGAALDLGDTSPQRPASRPVAPHFPAGITRVPVYLAAASLRPGAANSAREPDQHRFRTITRAIFDLTLTRSARDIDLDDLHLTLKLGDEPRDDQVSLQLAELVRDSSGSFTLDDSYIPPIACLAAAPNLRAELQALCALVVNPPPRPRRRPPPPARAPPRPALPQPLRRPPAPAPPRRRPRVRPPPALPRPPAPARRAAQLRRRRPAATPDSYCFTDLRASLGPLLAELRQRVLDTLPDRLPPRPAVLSSTACGSANSATIACNAAAASSSPSRPTPTRSCWPASSPPSPASPPGDGFTSSSARTSSARRSATPRTHPSSSPSSRNTATSPSPPTTLASGPARAQRRRDLPRPYDPDHARISLLAIPTPEP